MEARIHLLVSPLGARIHPLDKLLEARVHLLLQFPSLLASPLEARIHPLDKLLEACVHPLDKLLEAQLHFLVTPPEARCRLPPHRHLLLLHFRHLLTHLHLIGPPLLPAVLRALRNRLQPADAGLQFGQLRFDSRRAAAGLRRLPVAAGPARRGSRFAPSLRLPMLHEADLPSSFRLRIRPMHAP